MRKAAWVLLVLFVFSIPWEYSLEFGAPWGNIARVLGLATLLIAIETAVLEGRFRRLHELHWVTFALFGWFSCTYFWTVTRHETLSQLRGYAQEMVLVWLVWEFAETRERVRVLLRAWLAGSWVLATLTITSFVSLNAAGGEQSRFAPPGQDPNDVARYLAFGIPIAAVLLGRTASRLGRLLLLAYLPVGFAGVLLTASRSGLMVAIVALAGCGIAAVRRNPKRVAAVGFSVALAATLILFASPSGTLSRLSSTAELWQRGDLNQRVNIWSAGWRAFVTAPLIGHGAGSFATAAELAPEDTAHNTVLSILVEGGLVGLALAGAVVAFSVKAIAGTRGRLRLGLAMLMIVWAISSLGGTVWESRLTWLLFGIAAAGQRLAEDDQEDVGIRWNENCAGEEIAEWT